MFIEHDPQYILSVWRGFTSNLKSFRWKCCFI